MLALWPCRPRGPVAALQHHPSQGLPKSAAGCAPGDGANPFQAYRDVRLARRGRRRNVCPSQVVSHVVPEATQLWHLSHALHFHDPTAGGPLRGWSLLDTLQRSKLGAERGRGSSPVSASEGSWVPSLTAGRGDWGVGGAGGKGRELGLHSCWGTSACSSRRPTPALWGGRFLEGCRGAWRQSLGDHQPLGPWLWWSLGTGGVLTDPLCSRGGGELSLEATGGGVCFRGSKMPSQHALYPTRLASAQDADCSYRWLSPGVRPWVPSAHGVAGGYSSRMYPWPAGRG